MTNFFSRLPARWLVALLALLASAGPTLAQTVTVPTVVTVAPATSTIAEDQALLGGNVTSNGGAATLSSGVVYGPNGSTPTLGMSGSTPVYIGSGVGSYSKQVAGLTANVTYAFRAFATNSAGSGYGAVRYFATRPITPSVTVQLNTLNPRTPTYALSNVSNGNVTLYVTPVGGSATSFSTTTTSTSPSIVQPTPLADGTYTVYAATTYNWSGVDGTFGTITSAPQASDIKTFTINAASATPATPTISSTAGSSTSTTPIPFTVTFSKSVTGFSTSAVLVSNGTVTSGSFSGSGTTYTFSVMPTAAGSVTVNIPASAAQDASGTFSVAASPFSVTYVLLTAPVVTTGSVSGVTESMATLSGTVTSDGGASVTARGVVYSSSLTTPVLGASGTLSTNAGTGLGSFASTLSPSSGTGLTAGSTYAARAYATNSQGTSYGAVTYFTTLPPAPVVTSPTSSSNLYITRTPGYSFSTAATISSITVYVGPTVATATSIGTFSVGSSPVSVMQPASAPLADGTYVVFATGTTSTNVTSAFGNAVSFTVDAPPTPTISSIAGATGGTTNTSPIPFTVTFSESVTGFAANKVLISNGTVTNGSFSGSGTTYSFTVMPTTAGTATIVNVVAGAAQDAAGNFSVSTSAYSLTYAAAVTSTTWTGTLSTDWFTPGNWSAGVPTATTDASISAAVIFSPAIASGTATMRSLTLNSGATLNMSDGTLDIRADFTNNGTFAPTGGTVVLGTTASSNGPNILGSSRSRFWNLTVNSNGVLLSTSAGASARRLLTLNGAFVTQGYPLVLESDASGTAMVVNASSAGFVLGSATVQRYTDASGNTGTSGYRHYSAPVGSATVSSLSTSSYGGSFTAQVNAAYNTTNPNQLSLATYPNMFGYDESKIAGSPAVSFTDFDKGYQSPASLSDPLTVGRGYTVQIGNNEKVQFTGPLNNNTQTITGLTYAAASTSGAASAGWALIGNPYPAPLDWRTVGTATGSGLNGVDGAAYVFQSTSAYSGRYTSFTNNVGAGTGLIASGQGFFVRASTPGTTGSITLTNANRVTSYASPAFQRTTAETRPLLRLSLGLGSQPATVATAQDETFVYFEAGATNGYDGKYDAYKLANPSGYYLGSATPGPASLGLSIDGRAPLATTTATEIPLWVSLPAGSYTLTATELLNFATLAGGTQVQLRDAQLGTLTDLATVPSYSFSVAANAAYAGRFSLVFRPGSTLATLPGTALAQASATLYPNPAASATTLSVKDLPAAIASLQVEVVDVLGRVVSRHTLPVRAGSATQRLATDQLGSTLYLLRLTALDAQGQVQGALPTQRLLLNH